MSIKTIITAIIITLSASSAFAFGQVLQGCGPDVTFDVIERENNSEFSSGSSTELKLGLKFTIGKQQACQSQNAYTRDIQMREIRNKEAQTTSTEVNALNQKIAICKDFTIITAPASIIEFCGDLLNVKVKNEENSISSTRSRIPNFN